MPRIRSRDTGPEKTVRSFISTLGYRYRLHDRDLPGKPDIVLRKAKKVIFVHGCFWHLHKRCRDGTIPKSGRQKWKDKLERNVERDKAHIKELRRTGWKVLVIWECEIEKKIERVHDKLEMFLSQRDS